MGVPPVIIHLQMGCSWIFPCKPSSYGGTSISGNAQINSHLFGFTPMRRMIFQGTSSCDLLANGNLFGMSSWSIDMFPHSKDISCQQPPANMQKAVGNSQVFPYHSCLQGILLSTKFNLDSPSLYVVHDGCLAALALSPGMLQNSIQTAIMMMGKITIKWP